MPRRRNPEEEEKRRLAEFDDAYEQALASAQDVFRRIRMAERESLEYAPEAPNAAEERAFKEGFFWATILFGDDVWLGRERRASSQKGRASALRKRRKGRPEFVAAVEAEARAYRARNPHHRIRTMVENIRKKLAKANEARRKLGQGRYPTSRSTINRVLKLLGIQ